MSEKRPMSESGMEKKEEGQGLTPFQIKNLAELRDQKHQDELASELSHISKNWWMLSDSMLIIAFLIACGCLYRYYDVLGARIASAVVALLCAVIFSERVGFYRGFREGYRDGHRKGVTTPLD